jgi:hypothetical protein
MAKKGTPMGGMPFKTVAKLIDCISNLAKDDGKKLRDITQNNRNGVDPLANFQQCIQNAIDSMTNPFQ